MRHFSLLIFLSMSHFALGQTYQTEPVTALLGAFGPEIALLEQRLVNPTVVEKNGIRFVTGQLGTQRVVVALTGIGKTNAAMTTAFVLAHFRPQRVLFTGIAGGLNPALQPGDLVVGTETGYHDVRSVTLAMQPTRQTMNRQNTLNPAYFPADSALLALALRVAKTSAFEAIPGLPRPPKAVAGRIVTGDEFVNADARASQLRTDYRAEATEMEGAAVAQVCHQQGIPCLVIRSLSDRADGSAKTDIRVFLGIAARNSARLVVDLVEAIR